MQLSTIHSTDRDGKATAKTELPLPNSDFTLKVVTRKASNGNLYTGASCVKIKKEGGYQTETFVMYQDFNKCYANNKVRCTAKAVEKQHFAVLENIQTILADAQQHYEKVS